MPHLSSLTVLQLSDPNLEQVRLPTLPNMSAGAGRLEAAFSPYMFSGGGFLYTSDLADLPLIKRSDGLNVLWVVGHAWIELCPTISLIKNKQTKILAAQEFVKSLLDHVSPHQTVLVLDTCHAAAFSQAFARESTKLRLVIYGADEREEALSLPMDGTSRLMLETSRMLRRAKSHLVDLVELFSTVRRRLDKDDVFHGQYLRYEMHGEAVLLEPTRRQRVKVHRDVTVWRIRNALMTIGALTAVILIAVGWYYWSHVQLEIVAPGIARIAESARVVVARETPAENNRKTIKDIPITGDRVRLRVPAGNIIIQLVADYKDGAARALNVHLLLEPTISPQDKWLYLSFPPAEEIATHPGMAFVPVTLWRHGRNKELIQSKAPFWIDIAPPEVAAYLSILRNWLTSGEINADEAILSSLITEEDLNSVGLAQLPTLHNGLADIFAVIDEAKTEERIPTSPFAPRLLEKPCSRCPAPMSRHEAEMYCAERGFRLPTDQQWELAARGVDGRIYPWGDLFDPSLANVVGLPEKGDAPATLKPVRSYPKSRSPYGLIDLVGNAGDWVINSVGTYEQIYMGRTFRFNEEDATTFATMPVRAVEGLTAQEITARCVDIRD